jgi:uncharacterized protein
MASQHAQKVKHVPKRTCVGCRQVLPKRTMIRLVRGPEGVQIDATGKAPGRGAYIHDQRSCWETALKGPIMRSLRVNLTDVEREELKDYLSGIENGLQNS